MVVHHASSGVLIGDAVDIADTGRKRRTGLLRHDSLPPGHGLWIVPCEGVHTFGMKFAIDVVFLNRKRQVLKIRPSMPRRRISLCFTAHSVLELPAGTVESTGIRVGDRLEFKP